MIFWFYTLNQCGVLEEEEVEREERKDIYTRACPGPHTSFCDGSFQLIVPTSGCFRDVEKGQWLRQT
jgi:hypothetical protein